jgi:glutaredoxin
LILVLYTKLDCSLCEQMKRTIAIVQAEQHFELIEVFIEDDSEARERYQKEVPVLTHEGRILLRHRATAQALRETLASLRREVGS